MAKLYADANYRTKQDFGAIKDVIKASKISFVVCSLIEHTPTLFEFVVGYWDYLLCLNVNYSYDQSGQRLINLDSLVMTKSGKLVTDKEHIAQVSLYLSELLQGTPFAVKFQHEIKGE